MVDTRHEALLALCGFEVHDLISAITGSEAVEGCLCSQRSIAQRPDAVEARELAGFTAYLDRRDCRVARRVSVLDQVNDVDSGSRCNRRRCKV